MPAAADRETANGLSTDLGALATTAPVEAMASDAANGGLIV